VNSCFCAGIIGGIRQTRSQTPLPICKGASAVSAVLARKPDRDRERPRAGGGAGIANLLMRSLPRWFWHQQPLRLPGRWLAVGLSCDDLRNRSLRGMLMIVGAGRNCRRHRDRDGCAVSLRILFGSAQIDAGL